MSASAEIDQASTLAHSHQIHKGWYEFAKHEKLIVRRQGQTWGEESLIRCKCPGKRNDKKSKKFSKEKGQPECFHSGPVLASQLLGLFCSVLQTEWEPETKLTFFGFLSCFLLLSCDSDICCQKEHVAFHPDLYLAHLTNTHMCPHTCAYTSPCAQTLVYMYPQTCSPHTHPCANVHCMCAHTIYIYTQ